jgi:Tetratricopeptide repeat./Helix-turn-helix.
MRRERGLSQAQLARPELSDSYISLIESGNRAPTPAVLELLAAKLGCTVSYLLNGITDDQVQDLEGDIRQARMALENGHAAQARRRFEELLSNDAVGRFDMLRHQAEHGLALAAEACGDLDQAISILTRLRETARHSFPPERRIAIVIALSRCHREMGDVEMAIEVAEQLMGEMIGGGWSDDLIELGATLLVGYLARGDSLRAEHYTTELLAAADALGTPRAVVAANWNAALNADAAGRGEEAIPLVERALIVQSEIGDLRNLGRLRSDYALLLLRNRPGEAARSRDLLLKAEQELRESSAGTVDHAYCMLNLAETEMTLGHVEQAAEHIRKAIDILSDSSPDTEMEARLLLCRAYLQLGRPQDAAVEAKAATELLDELPATRINTENWLTAASVLEEVGDHEESRRAYQRAMESGGV